MTLALAGLSAPASAAPQPAPTSTAESATVTLITGDRVTLHGKDVSVDAGPGRERVRFLSQTIDNHRYVIPSDALALLRENRLDKRLFDVTELAALGAGDEIPLLVAYPEKGSLSARSALSAGEARVSRDLSALGLLAVRADLAARGDLWSSLTAEAAGARTLRSGVQKVWLDGRRRLNLDRSVPQIGAPTAWQAGYDGTGVTVAVLDSGIDQTHPDFAGQIAGTQDFTGSGSVDDEVGHGTHVASTVAGTGAASGGRYKGVAPGAKLLIGKVCGTEFCMDSQVLEGMIWAAERAPIISISLGGPDGPEVDPLEQAVNDLTEQHDTLFVISAGNSGFEGPGSIGSPSSADAALSVGAVNRDDSLANFSSRGPRLGDGAVKPDITAPGVGIVAAKAAHDIIGEPAPVPRYSTLSGTSMAAPHVAGAAAILTQQHPGWSARLRKNTLMASAKPTEGVGSFDQGAGRVDVARQITQTVTVDEGSISFGIQRWPHDDDQPVSRTVTYRNSGTAAVDLTLAVSGGPFTVAAATLTVPAGGTASTTVTADTRGDEPDGPLGGYLTATAAGGVRVSTPIGIDKEVESYDVTVRTINRDGSPSLEHAVLFIGLDRFKVVEADAPQATQVVRVPKGRYGVFGWVYTEQQNTLMAESAVVVDRDRTITVDARRAAPVRLAAPQRDAGIVFAALNTDWITDDAYYGTGIGLSNFDEVYSGPISDATDPTFLGSVNSTFAAPGAAGDFHNSPYVTDLAYFSPGRMFHGLRKSPRLSELAALDTTFAAEATGVRGDKANLAQFREDTAAWLVPVPFDLPFRRTDYVNPQTQWGAQFTQWQPPADDTGRPTLISDLTASRQPYRAGRTYRQDWNRGVFGPTVTQPPYDAFWITRTGDFLIAYPPLSSDGSGHPGFSYAATEKVTLYRGDTRIGEGPEFEVPPEPATYRLEATSSRGAPHTLSTEIRATWTFRSGHVEGEQFQRLPLHTVRFAPRLDDRNTAPAGRRFEIPVFVEPQPGADVGRVRSVRVEVSYDDGKTWRAAPVTGTGDKRVATVQHPRGAGFVSLRTAAADTDGNTVTQTVIRAYALR
ncbi:S8 family serine peptidase [Actinoplanes sp. NBC_00393]|uniref:S8 family serine peptidase n=1 Tax=Actinoplanes sp. NBC_00393 TaxID=2975953 RepID=UPI002E225DF4